MPVTLVKLVEVRSELVESILGYLDALSVRTGELPKYYPDHLRSSADGRTGFDEIRQIVQVMEDRRELEQWLAEERERLRRAGQDVERLAYRPRRTRPETSDGEDERNGTAPVSLPWDEYAGERFHRAVILGDPGFGKTWLLRWEAGRLAREAAQDLTERRCDLDGLRLPILVRLPELNRTRGPVEEALLLLVGRYRTRAFRTFVGCKLRTRDCVILFDAWDEVPVREDPDEPHSRQELGQRLQMFAAAFPQPRLLMSSRTVGYGSSPIPGAQEVELLAFDTPQIESFVRVWFGRSEQTGVRFLETLRQVTQVWGLARIPLMLALMCRAFQERKLSLPARRVELYEQCLRGLLRDWNKEEKGRQTITNAYVEGVLDVLRPVSLSLFEGGHEQFSESLLRDKMLPCLQELKPGHELYGRTAAGLIDELKRDGILIAAGDDEQAPLLFLHRTFHEYLTAGSLAERANREGWRAISSLIDKKSWLPEWEQVIVLLAGQMKLPGCIIQLLLQKETDDIFRHRLALAGMCLSEVPPSVRVAQASLTSKLGAEILSVWWGYATRGIDTVAQHLGSVLSRVAQVDPAVPKWVVPQIDDRDVGLAAVRSIELMGSSAAYPDVIKQLTDQLHHKIPVSNAWEAIGWLGPDVANDDLVDELVRMYINGGVTSGGLIALTRASENVIGRLSELLYHSEGGIRAGAVSILGQLPVSTLRDDVVNRIVELLNDTANDVRHSAIRAIQQLGAPMALASVLVKVHRLLDDKDPTVSRTAAAFLGQLGPSAGKPAVVSKLRDLMHRSSLLDSMDYASALALIGPTAVRAMALNRLLDMQHNPNSRVRRHATKMLGQLASTDGTPEVLTGLGERLDDPDRGVRVGALNALAASRRAAERPEIVLRVANAVSDPDKIVRRKAISLLGRIGSGVSRHAVTAALSRVFESEDMAARFYSVMALHRLGVTQHEKVPMLLDGLRESNEFMRQLAAEALELIMASGARIFTTASGTAEVRNISECEG